MRINKGDFAIAWRPSKGKFTWYMPTATDDDIVPPEFAVMAASVARMGNKRFVKNMLDWLEKSIADEQK